MSQNQLRVGIAGLGTVGGGVLRVLHDNAELVAARAGRPVIVSAVSARDRARDRGVRLEGVRWHDDPAALAADDTVDAVVELIGGSDDPAQGLVFAALRAGKPVVTANKALLARHGVALAEAAERGGASLSFEAAVAGGIPIIKTLREGLAANRIRRIAGILNGTCNFILTSMRERGREFADVLAEAQKLGYAEADPSFDIDGVDAAHKLAILAALAFGRPVRFEDVHIEGIRGVSALDIAFARELGYRIKLLGIARRTEAGIESRVHACMVPEAASLARVDGVYNAVVAEGDFVGRVMLEGRGAGAGPTASAVVADLIDLARAGGAGVGRGGRVTVRPAFGADDRLCRRLLSAPDGAGPPRRDCRCCWRLARLRGIAGEHVAARARAGRGGADRAGDARDAGASDACGAGPDRAAGFGSGTTIGHSDRAWLNSGVACHAKACVARRGAARPTRSFVFVGGSMNKPVSYQSDRNLALELVRVTEAAALAAWHWVGKGNKNEADGAATEAMRRAFDTVAIDGLVVIGEGEMDEAPMMYIGEKVGAGGPPMDIAVDPLEGTTLTSKGGPNALTVVALAEHGNFLHAPDMYMEKIGIGGGLPPELVSLDAPVVENLRNLARAKKCDMSDLVLCTLDRERHADIIGAARSVGARVVLLPDGDVAAVIATTLPDSGIDIFIGTGGAPEGVLSAAALRCTGGQMQGRLKYDDDAQIARAKEMGIADPHHVYKIEELAAGDVMFAATGVTSGAMLRGVRREGQGAVTHSIVMRSRSGTVRYIEAHHNFATKTWAGS
jgi:fructose-1,6-bisphosphatase class II